MLKRKNNILISILLLIFVGQASASSIISYSASLQSHSIEETNLLHTMTESLDEMNSSTMNDCCAEECNCSMSGCPSLALPTLFSSSENPKVFQPFVSIIHVALNQSVTNLYRPPILS